MLTIFLDIDGVLNNLNKVNLYFNSIDPKNVKNLNKLLLNLKPVQVVLSSSWRYLIFQKHFSLKGFEIFLKTHGIENLVLAGHTCKDEDIPDRCGQIKKYCIDNNITDYFILDDSKEDFIDEEIKKKVYFTDPYVGLSEKDVELILEN